MDIKDANKSNAISSPAMDLNKIEKDAGGYFKDVRPQYGPRWAWGMSNMQSTPPRDSRRVSWGKVLAFLMLLMIAAYNACKSHQLRDMLGLSPRRTETTSSATVKKPNFVSPTGVWELQTRS